VVEGLNNKAKVIMRKPHGEHRDRSHLPRLSRPLRRGNAAE
jgi:hypothetical protein